MKYQNPSLNTAGKMIEHQMIADSLFKTPPQFSDIRQGGNTGDCFLLASILAVLTTEEGPQIIQEMFIDHGTSITVRLFDDDNIPHDIEIEKSLPTKSGLLSKGALWVKILEKAYAAFHGGHYGVLAKGHTETAMRTLTGAVSPSRFHEYLDPPRRLCDENNNNNIKYSDTELAFFENMTTRIRNNRPITINTGNYVYTGLLPLHAYAVINTEDNLITHKKYIWIYNPINENRRFFFRFFNPGGRVAIDFQDKNKEWQVKHTSTASPRSRIELHDFCKAFTYIDTFSEVSRNAIANEIEKSHNRIPGVLYI